MPNPLSLDHIELRSLQENRGNQEESEQAKPEMQIGVNDRKVYFTVQDESKYQCNACVMSIQLNTNLGNMQFSKGKKAYATGLR